jgi:hypothetical protein
MPKRVLDLLVEGGYAQSLLVGPVILLLEYGKPAHRPGGLGGRAVVGTKEGGDLVYREGMVELIAEANVS